MAWLCRGMNDSVRNNRSNCFHDSLPVAYIKFVVTKIGKLVFEAFSIPTRVSLGSEKIPSHIIVYAVDLPTFVGKECNNFAANQAA